MASFIPGHIDPQNAVSPPVLYDPVPLLDEYLLALDVLVVLECALYFFQLFPHLGRRARFYISALVEGLAHVRCECFLRIFSLLIQLRESLSFFVKGDMLGKALSPKCWDGIPSNERRRCFALLIDITSLHLVLS